MQKRMAIAKNGFPADVARADSRTGAFMIVAMVCLVLASALLGTLLKMASLGRSQTKIEAAGLQAEWLAESAIERAAAKLADQADYRGETWNVPAGEFGGHYGGRVVIEIAPAESGRKAIRVTAQYPADRTPSARQSKRIVVSHPRSGGEPSKPNLSPASAEKPAR